jgi:hypothetical protein
MKIKIKKEDLKKIRIPVAPPGIRHKNKADLSRQEKRIELKKKLKDLSESGV